MKANIFLPLFNGFYETLYGGALDSQVDDIIESDNLENDTENNFDSYDFKFDFLGYSKKIAEHIFEYMKEEQVDLYNSYKFISLYQPKEYNFETDVITIEIDFNLDVLLKLIDENKEMLSTKIIDNFTSRDGFISNTTTDLNNWIECIKNESNKYEQMLSYIIEFLLQDDFDEAESIIEKCEPYNFVEVNLT